MAKSSASPRPLAVMSSRGKRLAGCFPRHFKPVKAPFTPLCLHCYSRMSTSEGVSKSVSAMSRREDAQPEQPAGWKFWNRYPVYYGDGMYTDGEFLHISKKELKDFLLDARQHKARFGIHYYFFDARYYVLAIKATPDEKPGAQKNMRADEAPPKAARKAIVRLQINGGYGRFTSLWLEKDGTCDWHGYEPGMRWASTRRSKLSEQEIKEIWEIADRLVATPVKDAYASKHADYTLRLVFDDKTAREIRIKHDKTTKNDDRPQELKSLLDKLWATRSQEEPK